nr:hypothetical protein [Kiloniellales bacterium]
MTKTRNTHKHLALMRHLLSMVCALSVLHFAHPAPADEAVDSGWIEFDPSELNGAHDYERISYKHIKISENPAIQTKALRVLKVEVEATNKTETNMFFDLGIIGVSAEGATLFVFNLSPTLSRISAKATT